MSEHSNVTAVSPLMKELAAYIAAAPRRALPKAAAQATKHHRSTAPRPSRRRTT